MFRVQPMANDAGVGREARSLPPGSSQAIVANGLAFDRDGSLFIGDTARGAIWRVELGRHGQRAQPGRLRHHVHARTRCA